RRHNALSLADQQETTVPEVPAWNAQPTVRRVVQIFVQGVPRLFTVADLFKNFSGPIQSSQCSPALPSTRGQNETNNPSNRYGGCGNDSCSGRGYGVRGRWPNRPRPRREPPTPASREPVAAVSENCFRISGPCADRADRWNGV